MRTARPITQSALLAAAAVTVMVLMLQMTAGKLRFGDWPTAGGSDTPAVELSTGKAGSTHSANPGSLPNFSPFSATVLAGAPGGTLFQPSVLPGGGGPGGRGDADGRVRRPGSGPGRGAPGAGTFAPGG